jgi:tripartite-type tricarboxylate transporter receptor subunit TctC
MVGELFKYDTGTDIVHVPYKGTGPAMTDVIGGRVPLIFSTMPPALPHIKAGTLRCLAVTGDQRWPDLPDVPTMVEAGYKSFQFGVDCALMAPAKTPPAIVKWLETETLKVLKTKDIQDKLFKAGLLARAQGAEACWKRVTHEVTLFKDIIEKAHVQKM